MKNRLFSRSVAALIVLSLLLTGLGLPFPAAAVPVNVDLSEGIIDNGIILEEEIVLRADNPIIAEESMILEYIDSAQFNAARHTQRLTELEDLNTYVFANADGTRSIYMMHENVKFVDEAGFVVEKDISLTSEAIGYGIVRSDIDLLIPITPAQGIDMEYWGFDIKLTPQGISETTSAVQSNNSIVYDNAYGENTKLIYTPLLSGIKEDIVLTEYTANASYTFLLETNGLYLYDNDNSYYLADNVKETPIFYLGDVLIYDAIGRPDFGTLTVQTITEGQEYLLTVTANDDFLSDPTTVYPVTIDPSITISDRDASDSIIDAPIFQSLPTQSFGAFTYNRVGNAGGVYGVGRTVVKLSGLTNSSEYQSITADQITNVTFYAKEASGSGAHFINLYALLDNTTWTESTATWDNIGSYSTIYNYGNTMSYDQWTAFNITDLVKFWKNGALFASAGFIMMNADETNDKCFCSSEFSTAANRPYVVMTYNNTVDVSASPSYMVVDQTKQLSYSTNPSGLSVTWSSSNRSVATVSETGLVTGISEGTVQITATCTDSPTGQVSSDSVTLYVYDSIGIKDNTAYYIMNYSSNRYLSLETASDTNLTNVYTRERSTSTLSQWKTEKQADGTFQLISVYSPTGKALDATGTNIDIYTDTGGSYLKFTIYRINSGIYKGLYYIRYGNYYVAQDADYNVYLTATSYSPSVVWSFMAVNQRDAELFCHDYYYTDDGINRHFDTSANKSYFKIILNGLGYSSYSYVNPSAATAYGYLRYNDDVFVSTGHGGPGIISFSIDGNVSTGAIAVNSSVASRYNVGSDRQYINSLANNELAQARCVIYLGCNTGKSITLTGTTYNLVDATFAKGAHFVLGTTETLYTTQTNNWLTYFLDAIAAGLSISQAMVRANSELGTIIVPYDKADGTEGEKNVYGLPSYYCGDTIQYLGND